MRAIFTVAPCLVMALAAAAPAFAQGLMVPIDHSVRLSVHGQAASVVIGKPQVADVTVVNSHTVFISGRGYGTTDVIVLDPDGREVYSGDIVVGAVDAGRVSVYRGVERTDLACAGSCAVSTRSPTAPAAVGSAAAGGSSVASTAPKDASAHAPATPSS